MWAEHSKFDMELEEFDKEEMDQSDTMATDNTDSFQLMPMEEVIEEDEPMEQQEAAPIAE